VKYRLETVRLLQYRHALVQVKAPAAATPGEVRYLWGLCRAGLAIDRGFGEERAGIKWDALLLCKWAVAEGELEGKAVEEGERRRGGGASLAHEHCVVQ
jgi:hypothetical protein